MCFSCGRFNHRKDECHLEQEMKPSESEGSKIEDKEDDNPSNGQGKVQKKNQDPPTNLEVINNCGPWMLAPCRVCCHQSSQYHEEDVGKRYGKGKSNVS